MVFFFLTNTFQVCYLKCTIMDYFEMVCHTILIEYMVVT